MHRFFASRRRNPLATRGDSRFRSYRARCNINLCRSSLFESSLPIDKRSPIRTAKGPLRSSRGASFDRRIDLLDFPNTPLRETDHFHRSNKSVRREQVKFRGQSGTITKRVEYFIADRSALLRNSFATLACETRGVRLRPSPLGAFGRSVGDSWRFLGKIWRFPIFEV